MWVAYRQDIILYIFAKFSVSTKILHRYPGKRVICKHTLLPQCFPQLDPNLRPLLWDRYDHITYTINYSYHKHGSCPLIHTLGNDPGWTKPPFHCYVSNVRVLCYKFLNAKRLRSYQNVTQNKKHIAIPATTGPTCNVLGSYSGLVLSWPGYVHWKLEGRYRDQIYERSSQWRHKWRKTTSTGTVSRRKLPYWEESTARKHTTRHLRTRGSRPVIIFLRFTTIILTLPFHVYQLSECNLWHCIDG